MSTQSANRMVYLLICFFVSSAPEGAVSAPLSFATIERLPLGSSQKEAEELFGKPSKTYRDKLSDKIHWHYVEGLYPKQTSRLSLTFGGDQLRLQGFSYDPVDSDEISTLKGLQAHFPKLRLKTVAPSSCGEHYMRNEGFDYDLAAGVFLRRTASGRVTDLSVSIPMSEEKRKTASELNGCTDKEVRVALEEITPALK